MLHKRAALLVGALFSGMLAMPASAQTVEEFYKNNPLRIIIGYSPGGGYDVYARLLARHISEHIPGNPEIITENLPGAGSVTLANQIANVLPSDGTVIGAVSRAIPVEPLLEINPTQYDARELNWIGSMTDEASVCVASAKSGIESWEQVVNGEKEIILGGTGAASDNEVFPRMQAELFGAKIRIISGYPGSSEVTLAMEQGEIDGMCGSWSSFASTRADMLESGAIKVLVVLSTQPVPGLEKYPLVTEFAKTDDQKQVLNLILSRLVLARPYVAAPGVPEDRLAALRKAFMDAAKDPDLVAEAKKLELELNPVDGDTAEKLIEEVYTTPDAVVENTRKILTVQ